MSRMFTVSVPALNISFPCNSNEYVLTAMCRAGLLRQMWGCRGGGCGICKVCILSGSIFREKMSCEHISKAEEEAGYALACRIRPESDLIIRLLWR